MADGKEKKRGPEWNVRLPDEKTSRLRRDTAFLCTIRFKNDLPEIPCDPKLLLPPYDKEDIAAFKLTELEKDLRKDLLFEPDLGIPIHPWNIERYSIPDDAGPLHPSDQALVESDDELEPKRARLRGDAAEVSWLLRTKYISANAGLSRGAGAAAGAAAKAAAAAAAEEDENEDPRSMRLRLIEEQFAAAKAAPVHVRDPSLQAVEVLPVFPDDFLEGKSCVLGIFDNDPLDDVAHLEGIAPELRARATQAHQLKSFKPPKGKNFVALLVPETVPARGEDDVSAKGGIPAEQLIRDYKWVREYTANVKYDDKGTTYLFRFADDNTVRFHDLNTKLDLRKRKRAQRGAEQGTQEDDEEDDGTLLPEKVLLRRPGQEDEEMADGEQGGAAGSEGEQQQQQAGGGMDWGEEGGAGGGAATPEGGEGSGGGGESYVGTEAKMMRDAFGSDDDDL